MNAVALLERDAGFRIDDVVDVIRDEADHSVMSMAGLDEDEDMFAGVITSARRRVFWLALNLATALLAAAVVGFFEATIAKVVALPWRKRE